MLPIPGCPLFPMLPGKSGGGGGAGGWDPLGWRDCVGEGRGLAVWQGLWEQGPLKQVIDTLDPSN